ncbi:MAG: AAA family ATPase [Hylemonella sp.]|nr:AAA family ATPase [Hylemonella sp.]MDP1936958.1 AAA family ATPase [Hylemonella sp.]
MPAQLIAFLQQTPAAFPHAVQGIECIETHISWVLLAGEHVYKFKKPLALDFLDYSTLALRRAACEEELRINRRTAPGIYLDVVAVTGTLQAPRLVPLQALEEGMPVLEWAVHMRRFAQDGLLSHLAAQGQLLPAHIDQLAHHIATFHASAAVAGADSPWGQAEAMREAVAHNFPDVSAVVDAVADRALTTTLQAVQTWSTQQGEQLTALMAQRRTQGWVRECHGDLHLNNLVLIDNTPQLFDAIEFNPAFRWTDVLADLAFVLMDLQAHGRADYAWRLLNAYLERTGDYSALRLLPYYQCYRAMVRAKVAALRWAQLQGQADAQAAAQQEVVRYLQLAADLIKPRSLALWLVSGVSGSGKSRHSQRLIERLGIVRVKADVERKRLFGLPALAKSANVVPGGIYTPDASQRTYARLREVAHAVLTAGLPVLVDATCLKVAQRQIFMTLAQELGVPCRILALDAPVDVLHQRVLQRAAKGNDPSEADVAVLEGQLKAREPLTGEERACAVEVDTSQTVDWAVVLPTDWFNAN